MTSLRCIGVPLQLPVELYDNNMGIYEEVDGKRGAEKMWRRAEEFTRDHYFCRFFGWRWDSELSLLSGVAKRIGISSLQSTNCAGFQPRDPCVFDCSFSDHLDIRSSLSKDPNPV